MLHFEIRHGYRVSTKRNIHLYSKFRGAMVQFGPTQWSVWHIPYFSSRPLSFLILGSTKVYTFFWWRLYRSFCRYFLSWSDNLSEILSSLTIQIQNVYNLLTYVYFSLHYTGSKLWQLLRIAHLFPVGFARVESNWQDNECNSFLIRQPCSSTQRTL